MKNKGFGHLKTRLFTLITIKISKNVGFGGPDEVSMPVFFLDLLGDPRSSPQ